MAAVKKKRKNAVVRYFTPFGLRQICDITMLVSAIILIVGMCLLGSAPAIMAVGLCLFILGTLIAIFRSVKVMRSGIKSRSPDFKQALVNTVLMGILAAAAIFALFWLFLVHIPGM